MSDEDQAATPEAEEVPRVERPSDAEQPVERPADDQADDDAESEDHPAQPDDGLTPRERRQLRLQQKRDRQIWTMSIVGGVVVLVVFMLLFWPVMAGRLNAAKQLDQAQVLLDRAKPPVAGVDKVVAVQLSAEAAPSVADVHPQTLVARRDLKQALALLDQALPHLTEDEQKRGEQIRTAAQSRLDMLDHAPAILVASVKAVKAKSLVDQAWKKTQAASAAEIAASSNYGTAKASGVESASVSLQRIKGQLGDARALYSQAASAFPGAGFDRYVVYVDLRLQGVNLFAQAASKWLKGDLPGASTAFSAYDKTVAKASAVVAKLPSSPSAPGKAFRKVAGPATDAYLKAKQQALDADKALGGQ